MRSIRRLLDRYIDTEGLSDIQLLNIIETETLKRDTFLRGGDEMLIKKRLRNMLTCDYCNSIQLEGYAIASKIYCRSCYEKIIHISERPKRTRYVRKEEVNC